MNHLSKERQRKLGYIRKSAVETSANPKGISRNGEQSPLVSIFSSIQWVNVRSEGFRGED